MVLSHANAPATERLCREARPFGKCKTNMPLAGATFMYIPNRKADIEKGNILSWVSYCLQNIKKRKSHRSLPLSYTL